MICDDNVVIKNETTQLKVLIKPTASLHDAEVAHLSQVQLDCHSATYVDIQRNKMSRLAGQW